LINIILVVKPMISGKTLVYGFNVRKDEGTLSVE
jgi:hypothetical protein